MNILEVQDIHTYYGDVHVLQGISLHAEQGSVVAVLGRNGAGKTTLLRTLVGFCSPRQGRIIYKGKEIHTLAAYRIARLGISLIPQDRRIFPSLTVDENLRVAERGKGASGWNAERVFQLFPHLKTRASHSGSALSGGEQQMLSISRALVTNPELLLIDEPSEGLAPLLVREVERMIRLLKQEGLTIVLVEQKVPLALGLADYVYLMNRGGIVYEGPPQDLDKKDELKSRYLGV